MLNGLPPNPPPKGLLFFAANKDKSKIFSTDSQKSKFYKVIVLKQLTKIQGWGLVDLPIDDEWKGFMIYNK